jgi:hypothetical protein
MSSFYIFVSSANFSHVTITLPHELSEGKWQIGLTEIAYSKPKTKFPDVDVHCDIIVPNVKNDKSSQILRRIYVDKGDVRIRFNPVLYCDVLSNTVEKINLYLRTDSDDMSAFDDTLLNCTLHLIKND